MVFTKIRFKLSLFMAVLLLLTALFFSLLTVHTMNRYVLGEVIKRAESLGKSASSVASYNILSRDMLGIYNVVARITDANPDLEYVAVMDRTMKIIAHSDIRQQGGQFVPSHGETLKENDDGSIVYEVRSPANNLIEVLTPITFGEKRIGTVIVGINKSVLIEAQLGTRNRVLAGLSVTLLIGIFFILLVTSFIIRPIRELAAGVEGLKLGKRSKPLKIYSRDELGKLTESFNQMTDLITSQQERLGRYANELEEAYVSTVRVLAAAIDARDPYTLGHSTRVARISVRIGEAMRLSPKEIEDLEIACLFHDVGKLRTPDFVLLKDGTLDSGEYREIIRHPEYGAEILSRAASLHKYIPAVKHHHEWYNGKGYPDGLSGEEIPLFAAIIAVADAFDAMTSTRPYKHSFSQTEALRELIIFSGKQFHPRVVEVFSKIIDTCTISEEYPFKVEGPQ